MQLPRLTFLASNESSDFKLEKGVKILSRAKMRSEWILSDWMRSPD